MGADGFETKRLKLKLQTLKLYNQGTQVASPVKLEDMRRSRATDSSYHNGNARAKKSSPGRPIWKSWSQKITMTFWNIKLWNWTCFHPPKKYTYMEKTLRKSGAWKSIVRSQTSSTTFSVRLHRIKMGFLTLVKKTCNNGRTGKSTNGMESGANEKH